METIKCGHDDLPKCIVCGRRITTKNYNKEFCSMKCKHKLMYHNQANMNEVEVLIRQYRNGGINVY
jgi:predicted nucleic acid-binding Zn ribbon protein